MAATAAMTTNPRRPVGPFCFASARPRMATISAIFDLKESCAEICASTGWRNLWLSICASTRSYNLYVYLLDDYVIGCVYQGKCVYQGMLYMYIYIVYTWCWQNGSKLMRSRFLHNALVYSHSFWLHLNSGSTVEKLMCVSENGA